MGLYCIRCGRNHAVKDHDALMEPSNLPLETPSHNGPYIGTLPVRELPPGESGELLTWESEQAEKRNKKQVEKAKEMTRFCAYRKCRKILSPDKHKRCGRYCNDGCRVQENLLARGPRVHKTSSRRRTTKWG